MKSSMKPLYSFQALKFIPLDQAKNVNPKKAKNPPPNFKITITQNVKPDCLEAS